MDNSFRLNIMTMEKTLFSDECEALTVTLSDGQATVLKDHAPMMAMLPEGAAKVKCGGKWRTLHTQEAFLQVTHDGVELFSRGCDWD